MVGSAYMIGFRIIHILAGVIWVGGVVAMVLFIQPSAKRLGPAGGPFVQEMLVRRRFPLFLLWSGGLTIAAGLFLYWRDWQAVGTLGEWVGTGPGAGFTIGAVAAIIAFLVGLLWVRPTVDRMLALAAELADAVEPPPAEAVAVVQALQARGRRLAIVVLTLLVVAVLTMATARYW